VFEAVGAIDRKPVFVWSARVSPSYFRAWLGAFCFTQVVEVPIWTFALRRDRDAPPWWPRLKPAGPSATPLPTWANLAIAYGASAITHPFVWFAFPRYAPGGYLAMVLQAELFAVLVEALYMRAFGLSWALGWSLVANGASAGLGLFSRELFGWP